MRVLAVVFCCLCFVGTARGEPTRVALAIPDTTATPDITVTQPPPDRGRRHAIYLEALGKGGIWGLGYEHQLGKRLALGGVASFSMLGGQRIYSLSPYLLTYVTHGRVHGWFVDAGAQLVRIATPSPVPEWPGSIENGIGAEVSSGYEYRDHFLFRIYGQAVVGKHGLAPWLGMAIGRTW